MSPWRLSLFGLLFLAVLGFSGEVDAEDEFPDVVNETAIEPQPADDDDDDGISNETIIMAAAVLGVCILAAAVILRR